MSHTGRLLLIPAVGAVAAVIGGLTWRWDAAPLIGWSAGALAYDFAVWLTVGRMNAGETRDHATTEDPNRAVADVLVLGANLASLGAVAYVVVSAANAASGTRAALALLALVSVASSWTLVQTLFTLRYARLYYGGDRPGGIEFNSDDPPTYADFAYLAFTMGMTYQVSDTNLQTAPIRATVLRHALISYVFGTVILATTINLVVGLSSG